MNKSKRKKLPLNDKVELFLTTFLFLKDKIVKVRRRVELRMKCKLLQHNELI